jgi:peptidoglycan/LPS O-acetylase OafA/YrhL
MVVNRERGGASGAFGCDPRYRTLDAWRGLACVMVVIHHAGYALEWSEAGYAWLRWLAVLVVRRMSLGVALFFVISGYCIAASVEANARRGDAPLVFLSRRIWRIYPPYWVALLGFAALVVALDASGLGRFYRGPITVALDPPAMLDWRQWFGNLTLTETWRPHVWGPERNVYTGVAWSLCFEEQFYMICFLALWLLPGRFFPAIGGATLAIVAVWAHAWSTGRLSTLAGTFPLLWHEFAAGLAVYYRLVKTREPREKRLLEAGLVTLLALGLYTGIRSTSTAAAFGLALVALRRWDDILIGLDWLAPFSACGRRCYSIYLAHLPAGMLGNHLLYELGLTSFWARTLVMIPLASAAGVAAGWAFHAMVESYFLSPPPLGRRLQALALLRRRARGSCVPARVGSAAS